MQLHHVVYILLSPFIIVLCLTVYIYESLIFNNEDRVEKDETLEAILSLCQALLPITACWFLYGAYGISASGIVSENLTFWAEEIDSQTLFPKIVPLVIYLQAYHWVVFAVPVELLWWNLYASFCERVFGELVPSLVLQWNSSVYQDLPFDSTPIRVLEVLPSSGSDPIKCNLTTVKLSTADYEALSYA